MDKDFWDKTFGGKDTLRLSIGAHSFRIRQNLYSSTATFEYGEGMRVRIVYGMHGVRDRVVGYTVMVGETKGLWTSRWWAGNTLLIRTGIQELTGLVLNCFE